MSNLISTDDPFSSEQKEALREILGYMIPAGRLRPSAADAQIFAEILATAKPHAALLHQALEVYAKTTLEGLSKLRTPEVNALVSFAVQCYYRDDRVMAAIDMEARPPHPQGYDLSEGDWSLLDPVRGRGKAFRDA